MHERPTESEKIDIKRIREFYNLPKNEIKMRNCLKCNVAFTSYSLKERLCKTCNLSNERILDINGG